MKYILFMPFEDVDPWTQNTLSPTDRESIENGNLAVIRAELDEHSGEIELSISTKVEGYVFGLTWKHLEEK